MIDKIIESAKMAESYKELFDLIDAIPPEGASVVARRCWGGQEVTNGKTFQTLMHT